MYTIKRSLDKQPMVPAKDLPGKKGGESSDGGNYMAKVISMCEPYDVPKSKKKTKKLAVWKGAKKFAPDPEKHGTFLSTDEGCFGRYEYIKQGYGATISYKDKNFEKEKKATACLRNAPFGSKGAPRRDEFHQHIAQLQWKELLEKEKRFNKATMDKNRASAEAPTTDAPLSAAATKKKIHAYDRAKGNLSKDSGSSTFNNNWKTTTNQWIQKKGYGIKEVNRGPMVTSSCNYGNFDLNAIERPKHARVSVTKEFNDISHLS
mmetsp:Transcript_23994/g.38558  ORF Transcript_23994/g.38558 Transcript_23994/m.38558 type:complete len:262 (+) Transcript_23994:286-1071(+)